MTSNMELQNTENTGKYECRSLLNCFSGGTVYDTSVRHNRYKKSALKKPIDTSIQIKLKTEPLIDLTTHLDDDEFNDHVGRSSVAYQVDNGKITNGSVKPEEPASYEYYSSQSIQGHAPPRSVDSTTDGFDSYVTRNSSNFSDSIFVNNVKNSENHSFSADSQTAQEEVFSRLSSLVSNVSDSNTSSDNSWQEGNGHVSNSRLAHKRKQTYIIRNDLFLEMPKEDCEVLNKVTSSNKSKKRKLASDKKSKKEKRVPCQSEKPFRQAKMNSILKCRNPFYNNNNNNYNNNNNNNSNNNNNNNSNNNNNNNNVKSPFYSENRILLNEQQVCASPSNSLSLDSNYSINENVESVKNSPDFTPFNSLQISKEFTQPNYFDYVQPLEKIDINVENLISPVIEVESPQVIKNSEIKSIQVEQVDCNGNKIVFQNEDSPKSKVSSNESVENLFFSKSTLAKTLGFLNVFNTSNDSVIDEVLFDEARAYKKIKLDLQWEGSKIITESCQFVNKPFESVSLLESLNELKRFGGLTEENDKGKLSSSDDDCQIIESSKSFEGNRQEEKISHSDSSCTSFSSQNDSNLMDDRSSEETITCSESETQKSSCSIKIKIKRIVNDEKNEYVIDDSVDDSDMIENKVKTENKVTKDSERYECSDCFEKFRTKKLLKSHVSAYHKGPYDTECDICHMKFKKSSAHKPHLPWCERYKKFKCNLCSKEYCYNASLNKHLKTHFTTFYSSSFEEEPNDPLA